LRIFLLFLFSFCVATAVAQPTLPDIEGTADQGVVLLSWNCQYAGIKAISVLRSTDSESNYANIGYVKKLDQGIQAFVDGHPGPGKNYYKLSIVFKTGLTWGSNHCGIYVDRSLLESSKVLLPSNDSLQHFIVTGDQNPCKLPTTAKTESGGKPGMATGKLNDISNSTNTTDPKHRVCISFGTDTSKPDLTPYTNNSKLPAQHKTISISFDDPEAMPATFIKSRFIATDVLTGHVNMTLPDDVNQHHYSIKFYDQKNHVIVEVPKVKAAKSIIDKRNFQHKGLYKFVLRRDVVELETGYITPGL
jgi:hypothetical protein